MQNCGLVASSGGGLDNFNVDIQFDNDNNKLVFCSFFGKIQCIFILDHNNKFLNINAPEGYELINDNYIIDNLSTLVSRDYGYHKYQICFDDLKNNRQNGFCDSSVIGAFYGMYPSFKAYIRIADNIFFVESKNAFEYEESTLFVYEPNYFKQYDESNNSNESNEIDNSISNSNSNFESGISSDYVVNTNKYLIVKNHNNN